MTDDQKMKSWIEIDPQSDFTIHNIPFGIFERNKTIHAGTTIGEFVLDLYVLQERGLFKGLDLPEEIFKQKYLNDFFSLGRKVISSVRARIIELLRIDNFELKENPELLSKAMIKRSQVNLLLPVRIPNYTDFYSSEEHATNVGSMFRDPQNALLPNWKHLPVGYHGRASSIVVSGKEIHRPKGQIKKTDSNVPVFAATRKLDFELEVAFITCVGTRLGESVPVDKAEDYIAGMVLFNDWSARDIQQWEYVPLGPFLGKNFGSTISPWVVTLDALEAFRCKGPEQNPEVLPYLDVKGNRNFDVTLEVFLQPEASEEKLICRSNMKHLYWNMNQQLAHHTVNGCNVEVGDLYASGTISGPSEESYGSMLELSWNGSESLTMPDGSVRTFLEDGDTVIMRGYAEKNGIRIGFGECRGKILPALT